MKEINKTTPKLEEVKQVKTSAITSDFKCGSDGGASIKEKAKELIGERPRKEPIDPRVNEKIQQELKGKVIKK